MRAAGKGLEGRGGGRGRERGRAVDPTKVEFVGLIIYKLLVSRVFIESCS